jgi:hypothetical protein
MSAGSLGAKGAAPSAMREQSHERRNEQSTQRRWFPCARRSARRRGHAGGAQLRRRSSTAVRGAAYAVQHVRVDVLESSSAPSTLSRLRRGAFVRAVVHVTAVRAGARTRCGWRLRQALQLKKHHSTSPACRACAPASVDGRRRCPPSPSFAGVTVSPLRDPTTEAPSENSRRHIAFRRPFYRAGQSPLALS